MYGIRYRKYFRILLVATIVAKIQTMDSTTNLPQPTVKPAKNRRMKKLRKLSTDAPDGVSFSAYKDELRNIQDQINEYFETPIEEMLMGQDRMRSEYVQRTSKFHYQKTPVPEYYLDSREKVERVDELKNQYDLEEDDPIEGHEEEPPMEQSSNIPFITIHVPREKVRWTKSTFQSFSESSMILEKFMDDRDVARLPNGWKRIAKSKCEVKLKRLDAETIRQRLKDGTVDIFGHFKLIPQSLRKSNKTATERKQMAIERFHHFLNRFDYENRWAIIKQAPILAYKNAVEKSKTLKKKIYTYKRRVRKYMMKVKKIQKEARKIKNKEKIEKKEARMIKKKKRQERKEKKEARMMKKKKRQERKEKKEARMMKKKKRQERKEKKEAKMIKKKERQERKEKKEAKMMKKKEKQERKEAKMIKKKERQERKEKKEAKMMRKKEKQERKEATMIKKKEMKDKKEDNEKKDKTRKRKMNEPLVVFKVPKLPKKRCLDSVPSTSAEPSTSQKSVSAEKQKTTIDLGATEKRLDKTKNLEKKEEKDKERMGKEKETSKEPQKEITMKKEMSIEKKKESQIGKKTEKEIEEKNKEMERKLAIVSEKIKKKHLAMKRDKEMRMMNEKEVGEKKEKKNDAGKTDGVGESEKTTEKRSQKEVRTTIVEKTAKIKENEGEKGKTPQALVQACDKPQSSANKVIAEPIKRKQSDLDKRKRMEDAEKRVKENAKQKERTVEEMRRKALEMEELRREAQLKKKIEERKRVEEERQRIQRDHQIRQQQEEQRRKKFEEERKERELAAIRERIDTLTASAASSSVQTVLVSSASQTTWGLVKVKIPETWKSGKAEHCAHMKIPSSVSQKRLILEEVRTRGEVTIPQQDVSNFTTNAPLRAPMNIVIPKPLVSSKFMGADEKDVKQVMTEIRKLMRMDRRGTISMTQIVDYGQINLHDLKQKFIYPFRQSDGMYWPLFFTLEHSERHMRKHVEAFTVCNSFSGKLASHFLLTSAFEEDDIQKKFDKTFSDSDGDWSIYSTKQGRFSNRKGFKAQYASSKESFEAQRERAVAGLNNKFREERDEYAAFDRHRNEYRSGRSNNSQFEADLKFHLRELLLDSRIDVYSHKESFSEFGGRVFSEHPGTRETPFESSWYLHGYGYYVKTRDDEFGRFMHEICRSYERLLPRYDDQFPEWCCAPMLASLHYQMKYQGFDRFSREELQFMTERRKRYFGMLKERKFSLKDAREVCKLTTVDKKQWTILNDQLVSHFRDFPAIFQLMYDPNCKLLPTVHKNADALFRTIFAKYRNNWTFIDCD